MPARSVRRRGAVELCAGSHGGRPAVLLTVDDETRSGANELVASVRSAHEQMCAPGVASIIEAGPSWLAFDCDGVVDLEDLVGVFDGEGLKVPYPQGIALNEFLMDSVEAGHQAGVSLGGALCWGNVLVGPSGKLWLFGLGDNFVAQPARGLSSPGISVAPEVAFGRAATTASDVYVLHAFVLSLLPFVEMPELYDAAFQGSGGAVREVHAALMALSHDVMVPDPAVRPASVAALRERYREVRRLAGAMMPARDDEGLEVTLAAAVTRKLGTVTRPPLHARADASALRYGEIDIDLSKRRSLRLIVARLLTARREEPGAALTIDTLSECGWPGERVIPSAARARIYVAISTLRKLGLSDVLVRSDEGYFLDPNTALHAL